MYLFSVMLILVSVGVLGGTIGVMLAYWTFIAPLHKRVSDLEYQNQWLTFYQGDTINEQTWEKPTIKFRRRVFS